MLTRNLRGRAYQISPPFVITEAEITQMVDGLAAGIEAVAAAGSGAAVAKPR